MFLKSLKLTNFRNYQNLNFEFKNKITVLRGNNAQGKTSFLESIYFLATTKSSRADREDQLVKKGENFTIAEGSLDNDTDLEIAIVLNGGFLRKKVKVNGVARRVIDYSENMAAILFSPEDINLVTGSPGLRRYHVDITLSQVDKNYKKTISAYENIVVRKNKVLKAIKEGQAKKEELVYWADQQILLGGVVSAKREEFFNYLNSSEKKFGPPVFDREAQTESAGGLSFEYVPSFITKERLREYIGREIEAATSLIGPHRDDFIFKLNSQNLSIFGSRGEQRTAVLDLKLAEVFYFEKSLGDRPVLLLDDIFSELDEAHRQHVIDISKLQQTIIATVEMDEYLKRHLRGSAFYSVESGQISGITDKL